ncbi:MAG: autotransporter assembly complex protein TamA [Phyllobacterium sp.]
MFSTPASAFSLFGIKLWGGDKAEETDSFIDDPRKFDVEISTVGGGEDAEEAIQNASGLWSDREKPASGSAGLLAKARGDYRRILASLYTEGRYGGVISIKVNGREAADLPPDATLTDPINVKISVEPGSQFLFSSASVRNAAPPPVDPKDKVALPADEGFAVSGIARSGTILRAERLSIEAWRQQGHAKASASREVVADHATSTIDATIDVDPGRMAYFAPVEVSGAERMDPEFIAYMTGLKPGQEYDPDDIDRAKRRLARLEVFRAAQIVEGDKIGENGLLPMSVVVQERKPRRFGVGANYSTLDGAGFEAFWMHRNLFGKAERLRFDARIGGIGGQSFDPQDYNYLLGVTFTKPGVFTPDTDFVSSLVGERKVLDNYTQTSVTGEAGFDHIFSDELTGRIRARVSRSQFDDDVFGERDFLTVGALGGLTFDNRDSKVDPTSGFYLEGLLNPFYEIEYGNFATKMTAEGRAYYGFGAKDRVVLAGRLKLGSIVGAEISELPPDQLFFAGGGGSVRGYAYRNIGVVTSTGEVIGGRSLIEGSAEVRTKVTDTIGIVGFVDAGYVGEESYPSFSQDLRVGVGAGVRYQTGLGPIRLDAAFPLDRRDGDPDFGLYVGIGQAF